jgi:hypothetical protein
MIARVAARGAYAGSLLWAANVRLFSLTLETLPALLIDWLRLSYDVETADPK